ncbi:hypothetical protein [uncultured Campylobacter sp.]|nr:hypothetical protein [uncultured Campylobacter sp.]
MPTRDGSNFIAEKVAAGIANFDVLPHRKNTNSVLNLNPNLNAKR